MDNDNRQPVAMRERSKETRRSLISRLDCSSTSTLQLHNNNTFLIVSNNSSGNSLTNSYNFKTQYSQSTINLSDTTTTLNGDTDIKISESLSTEKKNRLDSLHLKAFRLHDINGLSIEFHNTLTQLAMSNSNGSFLKHAMRLHYNNYHTILIIPTLRPKA